MKTKIRKSTLLLLGMLMLVPTLNAQNHRNDRHREEELQTQSVSFMVQETCITS